MDAIDSVTDIYTQNPCGEDDALCLSMSRNPEEGAPLAIAQGEEGICITVEEGRWLYEQLEMLKRLRML